MSVMNVELIAWTPNPELLAAAAARLCYEDISATNILHSLSGDDVDHLLDAILSSGHLSVVEHITFTFAIDGVSRVLTHQLVRHRVGVAFSQQSQRYARVTGANCIMPRSIQSDPRHAAEAIAIMEAATKLYKQLLDAGVPNEDARYVLPQAIETRLVMTANLRALMQMYRLDACLRSQWEMRYLVNSMKREIRRVSPRLASELKIKCFSQGYCDEAVMCRELESRMPRRDALLHGYEQYTQTFYQQLAVSIGEEDQ
jgi:thymidylate synthase (FAD)